MTGTDPRAVVTFIYKNTREEEEPRRRKNCRFTVAHCGSRVKNDSGSDADAPTPRTDKKFYNLSAQFYESRITKTQLTVNEQALPNRVSTEIVAAAAAGGTTAEAKRHIHPVPVTPSPDPRPNSSLIFSHTSFEVTKCSILQQAISKAGFHNGNFILGSRASEEEQVNVYSH
ncbi:hypothetical protein V9T40_000310 [Parthenolecanium corni]|uniref:Uncharacterized protein n=1 Tax=Parthenolecanium corni TaxID=536013 RepID=A0AAN9TAU7_9HEMI